MVPGLGMPDCLVPSILPPVVLERALVLAGDNRQELERVLHHCEGDSLKQFAARFLIANMPYHFYEDAYSVPGGK